MALLSPNVVQNVGDMNIMFAHNKIHGGNIMNLGGFRLQGEFLGMSQLVENSVLVPLLGGGSVQLTNSNQCGQISFNSIRTGMLNDAGMPVALDQNGFAVAAGSADAMYDIVSICDALRQIDGGDGVGGTFLIESRFNGNVFRVWLYKATLVRSPPFIASGTDVPNYTTIFNYARPIIKGSVATLADAGNGLNNGTVGSWVN